MVTAGHSLIGAEAVSVCFDKGPISYTIQDGQIIYYGTRHHLHWQHPYHIQNISQHYQATKNLQTSDIGLIILDQPVKGVTEFPTLPQAGFTETLAAKTDLTVIGYGMQIPNQPTKQWSREFMDWHLITQQRPSTTTNSQLSRQRLLPKINRQQRTRQRRNCIWRLRRPSNLHTTTAKISYWQLTHLFQASTAAE